MAASAAVTRAQNRAIAKGTDPKAATCRAKLQRARSALNRQMDRELRLREGAENLLRATAGKDSGGDNGGVGGRNKSKSRKLIRQTVALELSFLESNVRLLADELAELNGSVDVYQHRDDSDCEERYRDRSITDSADGLTASRQRRRQCLMPMIAVPLKDTRPIDFGPPLERFINQHYGVDLSTASDDVDHIDDGSDRYGSGSVRRRSLSLREAVNELTQLRLDTQTPSRDADGVRLLLRYYRQLYYVDRRFFPPTSTTASITTTSKQYHHNHHHQHQDHHYRHHKQQHPAMTDTSLTSTPPAIYFEWYDSFGGPVPSCGQRTVRFEQACVLFNVAAVHTQMGAKHDRRSFGGRDEDGNTSGIGKSVSSSSTSTGPETTDGATAATQCFLRAAGAYRHIGDTFANAPARAADLRATGVLYAVMMAQAHECAFEKLQWRFLTSVRHRCRRYYGDGSTEGRSRMSFMAEANIEGLRNGVIDRRGQDVTSRRTPIAAITNSGGTSDVTAHAISWTELAREAAHLSRMYGDVVYNSFCRPNDGVPPSGKENGAGTTTTPRSVLPDVWVSVCQIKDRHYAALAYRYAACALLPYYQCSADSATGDRHHRHHGRRRDRYPDDTDAGELLTELMAAAAAAGLELVDDDDTMTSTTARLDRCRKQLGKLLLEAAAAAHDRAARALRLCRQLRGKSEGNAVGGSGGLLAGVIDRERHRTVRLLLLHRRNDDEYATAADSRGGGAGGPAAANHCCCRRRRGRWCSDDDDAVGGCDGDYAGDDDDRGARTRGDAKTTRDHDCFSDDNDDEDDGGGVDEVDCAGGVQTAAIADYCSGGGDQEEFTAAGIAGIPGLDVDRGVLIRPRTRFRLMSIAPDFTDTGDDGSGDDYDIGDTASAAVTSRQRPHEAADREERRADLFAGLGPVAVFSARHRYTRPRWVRVVSGGGRRRSACDNGKTVAAGVDDGGGDDDDDKSTAADPIQLVDRWFGFELRSYGGGTAAAVPPACVGHVRSNSQAQHVGLRRGDIVVALRRTGDGGQVLDVRWDTSRRVAELIVRNHQRCRQQLGSGDGAVLHLKVVTPITAVTASTSDGHATSSVTMDPNKMYPRRRTTAGAMNSPIHSTATPMPLLPQSTSKQQRRQRRQNANSGNEATSSTNKTNTWLWNPFRRRRRSVVGK